ncbi:MAG: 16S rRNA (adenine(1518)-N(6)/adenine(1519)-N(6))-dimethyltransferase RsmA [Bacteroidales bacterium]|nr:16S rRNA (adenine(1518)-N(6)/adenine(1519)-N(6))-dimethyltransferase RsmA [Bacteroidales bacterium]
MKQVRPKKFLGQHFLTDLTIASAIADTVDAYPDIPVLEVGPGMGVMTQFLIKKPRPLKVVEIDFESVEYLRKNFPQLEDNIIEDDFLKMHLDRTFLPTDATTSSASDDTQHGCPFVLTGNYPYNISSQIFFKMLDNKDLIPCCTGMIQKEVAERITAKPGNKTYGILSVLIQAWYSVEYLFTVHEHVFNPPPKVKSAVIRMTRNDVTSLGCDERLFKRIVKTTFNQRRKTLRNNIRPLLNEMNAQREQQGLAPIDYSTLLADELFNKRPEQLSVQDFIDLTNRVETVL